MNNIPPYYGNPDDASCAQCSLKMALEYLLPQQDWSFSKLAEMTCQIKDMSTWEWPEYNSLVRIKELEIKIIYPFDVNRFALEGNKYLQTIWGDEVFSWVTKNSDMNVGHHSAKEFVELLNANAVSYEMRSYTIDDMKVLLNNGYLLIPNTNYRVLANRDGYVGHSILVYGYNDNSFLAHDPGGYADGMPEFQIPERVIPNDLMQRAILLPKSERTESLLALRINI